MSLFPPGTEEGSLLSPAGDVHVVAGSPCKELWALKEAGRYAALQATAEDSNLDRQGIDGNFYLGRRSIGISR